MPFNVRRPPPRRLILRFAPSSGGILNFHSIAGTLTTSGVPIGKALKFLAGLHLHETGVVVKKTIPNFAGTLTSSGIVSKKALLFFAGILTPAGVPLAQALKVLAGTLTTTGSPTFTTLKVLAGLITPSGFFGLLSKRAILTFSGSLSSSGVLSAITIFTLAVAGALTSSGVIIRDGRKVLAGIIATTNLFGVLSKLTSLSYAGVLTTTGAPIKKFITSLAGSLTSSGILSSILNPISIAIDLTLNVRSALLTLNVRATALTLIQRVKDFTLNIRT